DLILRPLHDLHELKASVFEDAEIHVERGCMPLADVCGRILHARIAPVGLDALTYLIEIVAVLSLRRVERDRLALDTAAALARASFPALAAAQRGQAVRRARRCGCRRPGQGR